jgi:pimeloyl-ACP methyl ester carboxylesterase
LWFELVNNRGAGAFDTQLEGLRQMWLDNFGRKGLVAPPAEPLTGQMLSGISTPTLALEAEYGMPYSRRIVEKLAGWIPGCQLVEVPCVAHFLSYQAPTVFNRVVMDFLAHY